MSRDKNILIKYNRFPHIIGAFPPIYCKKTQKFIVPKTGFQLYIFPLVFFAVSVDILYLWIKVTPGVTSQTVTPQDFMNFYIHTVSRSCGCLLGWLFYFRMDDLMHFSNAMFSMEEYFEGNLFYENFGQI